MAGADLLDHSPTETGGQFEATFGFTDVVVRVRSTSVAPLEWLDHFLRPWFESDVEGGTAEATVELVIDGGEAFRSETAQADRVAQRAPCFLLDGGIVRHPIVDRRGNALVVADGELRVSYLVEPGRVTIFARSDGAGSRVALMRVVREMCVSRARMRGRPLLHSAVAAFPTGAIAISGPKRSAKTTLLLHMLSVPATRFLANDRAVAFVGESGAVALGMPTITALRADSVNRFPQFANPLRSAPARHWLTPAEAALRGGLPWSNSDRSIDLSPADFCELIGVETAREAGLRALVFSSVDPAADGIELRRLSAAETLPRLRAGLVGAALDERPMSVFTPREDSSATAAAADSAEDDEQVALARLAQLPSYEARLGPNAYARAGLPEALLRHVT